MLGVSTGINALCECVADMTICYRAIQLLGNLRRSRRPDVFVQVREIGTDECGAVTTVVEHNGSNEEPLVRVFSGSLLRRVSRCEIHAGRPSAQ